MPVHLRGRIVPNYAMIDNDERIPFWRALGKAVHEHDCKFILQLSHGGRQRDIPAIEYPDRAELDRQERSAPRLRVRGDDASPQIKETVQAFAEGARRAREAGLDGVELHGANGYLITQFLSSAINDRKDEYGGSLENRARFVLDIVQAIRARVGRDFHLQMKISATESQRRRCRSSARGPAGNTARGLDAGLPVAGRRRRRRDPRVDRQLLPASAESRPARPAGRGAGEDLRHA